MDIDTISGVAKGCDADAVHPGYGFLSESPAFASRIADLDIKFVGPSVDVLGRTGDKLTARQLAVENDVPVLPASTEPTSNVDDVQTFATKSGFPIMIKAVDGGGGRGIRLVRSANELADNFRRACGESPSGQVFVEKAAVDGFRHVEVQVLGDEHSSVTHLWERECSIQRRFQKIVEIAPSTIQDREVVGRVIDGALRMARAVCLLCGK
jgi:pyruvate carboxylase